MSTIPKFKINDIAEVVKKEFGHGFNIGDQVLIVEINYDKDGRIEDYKCLLGKEDWFLRGEELKPITLSPQLATDGRESITPCGWTRVEDGLPEDGQRVVVVQNPKTTATRETLYSEFDGKVKKFKCVGYSHDGIHLGVAHWSDIILWMPLPTKPENI